MVQVLPARQQQEHRGSQWGKIIGDTLKAGVEGYQARRKQVELANALGNAESDADSDLDESQKLLKLYKNMVLSGNAEHASKLVPTLGALGKQKQSFKNQILQQQQTEKALQSIQELYDDPNLSEEKKVFGIYHHLSQNPTLAKNLLGSLQEPSNARGEAEAGDQFTRGFSAIQSGDSEALNEVLDDPNTPLPVRQKLVDLFNQGQTRKSVQEREFRNRQALVIGSYDRQISAEQALLKSAVGKTARQQHASKIKKLEVLRQKDLELLSKHPEAYRKLYLWKNIDSENIPTEEELNAMSNEDLGFKGDEEEGLTADDMDHSDVFEGEDASQPPEIQERIKFLNSSFPPDQFSGKMKQDKNGRVYRSDGRTWQLVQG
jgi:hypothetical protein